MSASHHNVTCAAGEWAASNTFSMIASKVWEGISWPSHLQFFWLEPELFVAGLLLAKLLLESESESWGRVPKMPSLRLPQLAATSKQSV